MCSVIRMDWCCVHVVVRKYTIVLILKLWQFLFSYNCQSLKYTSVDKWYTLHWTLTAVTQLLPSNPFEPGCRGCGCISVDFDVFGFFTYLEPLSGAPRQPKSKNWDRRMYLKKTVELEIANCIHCWRPAPLLVC